MAQTFSELDLVLAAKMLRLAAKQFSTYICNDIPEDWLADYSEEQKKTLAMELEYWNSGKDHYTEEEKEDALSALNEDWCLMNAIANRLDGSSK